MRHPSRHLRCGMSLVELLVVVAILGLLAVAVLPTVASTTESRRTREAARVASSFIASAQSRALGRREWSGFRVVPSGGGNVALDLSLVDVPPPYRGDTASAEIAVAPPAANATMVSGTGVGTALASAQTIGVGAGDLIRFADRDPWYRITSIDYTTAVIEFAKRGSAGQTSSNTPWPPDGNQPFEIALAPVSYGTAVTLGEGRVIDITQSGFDDAGIYTPFNAGTVTVLFDGTGRLRQLIRPGVSNPTTAPGPILLLVGRADRAGQSYNASAGGNDDSIGANWQYADSFWVMINPGTGSVHQAACDPPTTNDPVASQSFVRSYLSAGGGS
jgi:prepilin-type N-terminal cleavage/methylation domain-containing protein